MPESMAFLLTEEPELPGDTIVSLTKQRREWLAGRYLTYQWDMEELLRRRPEIEDDNLLRDEAQDVVVE